MSVCILELSIWGAVRGIFGSLCCAWLWLTVTGFGCQLPTSDFRDFFSLFFLREKFIWTYLVPVFNIQHDTLYSRNHPPTRTYLRTTVYRNIKTVRILFFLYKESLYISTEGYILQQGADYDDMHDMIVTGPKI